MSVIALHSLNVFSAAEPAGTSDVFFAQISHNYLVAIIGGSEKVGRIMKVSNNSVCGSAPYSFSF